MIRIGADPEMNMIDRNLYASIDKVEVVQRNYELRSQAKGAC